MAPAAIFSKAEFPESTPPTPIICILLLVSLKNFCINLVERLFKGFPDNPPASFFLVSDKALRLPSVVFETIIPSILYFLISSIILLISLSAISGESLTKIGFEIFLSFLILFMPLKSLSNSF